MGSNIRYFIGNWKMFGVPGSYKIISNINAFFNKDRNNNKKYKIIIAPPFTLLQNFSNKIKNKPISLSAQNCSDKDNFGSYTGHISPYMIKKIGINYTIIGHSECRMSGETDKILENKVKAALKNKLTIIFCVGENKSEKKNKKTLSVLKKQISKVLKKKYDFKKIIIAYEPIWSIGSGKTLSTNELYSYVVILKKFIKKKFSLKSNPKLIYGGSVDQNTINAFKNIRELDGFLIGGASKSSKNFIDIIKNFYK